MSTNKTKNYQLHAWEPGDDFLLSEINENFEKLDGSARVVSGCYEGNYLGNSTPNLRQQAIVLGFQPRVVVVFACNARVQFMAVPGHPANDGGDILIVTEEGFSACSNMNTTGANSASVTYFYLAVR